MDRLSKKRRRRSRSTFIPMRRSRLRSRCEDKQGDGQNSNCDTTGGQLGVSVSSSTSTSPPDQTEPSENSSISGLPDVNGRSPSPARIVRLREHAELQNLNDRLVSHATHVKMLQTENARLRLQLETMEELTRAESVKAQHIDDQAERQRLQASLDALFQEKAQAESAREALERERDRLVERLMATERQAAILQVDLDKLKPLCAASTILEKELSAVKATLQQKVSEVERAQAELVKEQRRCERLEQELASNKERYLKDMEEASTRYVHTVSSSLASVRDQHKRDLEALKLEVTSVYQAKICEWKEKLDRSEARLQASMAEAKTIKQENDDLKEQTTIVKAAKAAIEVQLREACSRNEESKWQAEKERCQSQREMALLSTALSEVKEELEEVGGVNSRLDGEITVYRELLDALETKSCCYAGSVDASSDLDLMEVEVRSNDEGGNLAFKGHTTEITYIRTGDGVNSGVKISEVDHLGRYVRLSNETDHLVDLCLWVIHQTNHSSKKTQYEITSETRVSPGGCVTIWSQGQRGVKDGPSAAENLDVICDATGGRHRPTTPNNVHLTMTDKSWLQVRGPCRYVLKDGDGQKQNECDVTMKPSDSGENFAGTGGQGGPKSLNNCHQMLSGVARVSNEEVSMMDTGSEDDMVIPSVSTTPNRICPYGLLTTCHAKQSQLDAFDPLGGGDGVLRRDKDSCLIS